MSQSSTLRLDLLAIRGHKTAKRDRLRFIRIDNSQEEIEMPRQGILPHDLVHALVEQGFSLKDGFMSLVAMGASPAFLMSKALPQTEHTVIAESVVEAMQTQLAQGHMDYPSFIYGVETACASRGINHYPVLSLESANTIFLEALALNEHWRLLTETQTLALTIQLPHLHQAT